MKHRSNNLVANAARLLALTWGAYKWLPADLSKTCTNSNPPSCN